MKNVSELLSDLIERSGLSYRDLEKRTGIPRSAIQRYATASTNKIPIDRLQKICQVLGTSAEKLLGWTDDTPAQPPEDDDPEFITLAHRLKRLDPADRKRVEDMIKLMFPEDFE